MPILQWLDKDKHIKAHKNVPYRILTPHDTTKIPPEVDGGGA